MKKKLNYLVLLVCIVILLFVLKSRTDLSNSTEANTEYETLSTDITTNEMPSMLEGSNTTSNTIVSSENNTSDKILPTTPALLTRDDIQKLKANTIVDASTIDSILTTAFYSTPITDEIKSRIYGISYKEDAKISLDALRYIRVLHHDYNGDVRIGELIVNKSIAGDILDIFHELYEANYPIEKMVLIDEYQGDDDLSMEDNNTSSFNYRTIAGSTSLSKHSLGQAIDINPLYNPYIKEKNGITTIQPNNGIDYVNRDTNNPYYIIKDDVCYNAFINRGFTWGGSWNSLKDYQHFEK